MANTHSHGPHDHHDHDHAHHHHPGGGDPVKPEQFVDPAQQALVGALHASFGVLRLVMIVLAVLYLLSGVFRVQTGEQGLIVRFGVLRDSVGQSPIFGPGWHAALPDPFEQKILISGGAQELDITSFLFRRDPGNVGKPLAEILPNSQEIKPGVDGSLLSGDRGLAFGDFKVQYRVTDAESFVQNIGETLDAARPIVWSLAETAVVREAAQRPVKELTYTARTAFASAIQSRLQNRLNELKSGITVDAILADTIEPGRVREAFMDESNAEAEKNQTISQAETTATETLNQVAGAEHKALLSHITDFGAAQATGADEARLTELRAKIEESLDRAGGMVSMSLGQARQRANTFNLTLRGQYDSYQRYLKQFQDSPKLTLLNLWVQMRIDVLGNPANEIMYLPDASTVEIWTNRDKQRQIDEQMRNMQRQLYGPR